MQASSEVLVPGFRIYEAIKVLLLLSVLRVVNTSTTKGLLEVWKIEFRVLPTHRKEYRGLVCDYSRFSRNTRRNHYQALPGGAPVCGEDAALSGESRRSVTQNRVNNNRNRIMALRRALHA